MNDPHRQTAALIYDRVPSAVTKEQRLHGKVVNVLAAHGQLRQYKLIAELAGVTQGDAMWLVRQFREKVLGVTEGVDGE